MATIQEVYIALFGRPADPIGYDYYVEATNDGANLDAVGDLSASAEYTGRFEGMSNIEMVNQIYMDLFGRPADNAGLAFYVGQLNSGAATSQSIAIQIIDGAQNEDAEIIANKVEAANLFTETVRETEGAVAAYSGDAAADAGREFLNGVDENDDSIPSEEDVQDLINDIADGDFSGGVGQTFTLQAAEADNFDGTSGDDLFRAPQSNSLETIDTINGGAGIDTLRATLTASAPAPVMSGVENVYLTAGSAAAIGLDLDQVSGVQQLWAVDVAAGGFTASNVSDLSTTFGAETAGAAYTYDIELDGDISGSDDTLMLAVDDVDGNAVTFTVDGAADDDIESISVAAMGDDDGTSDSVNLGSFDGVEDVTVTGSGDITVVGVDSDELETFDATAAEGNVIADLSAVDDGQNLTIMGGAGDDVLTSNGGESLITGGAGNDTLVGGIGDDIFGGGAGLDGIDLSNGGSDEVHLDGFAGLDTVTGFQAEADGTVTAGPDGILGNADDVTLADGQDVISFLDGGVIDFANSDDDSGRGDSDLDDDDYNEFASITALQASTDDLDQSVVNVTGGDISTATTFTTTASAEFYAAFTDGTNTFIYYDEDWSNNDGRNVVATVDATGLSQDNFDIYA